MLVLILSCSCICIFVLVCILDYELEPRESVSLEVVSWLAGSYACWSDSRKWSEFVSAWRGVSGRCGVHACS